VHLLFNNPNLPNFFNGRFGLLLMIAFSYLRFKYEITFFFIFYYRVNGQTSTFEINDDLTTTIIFLFFETSTKKKRVKKEKNKLKSTTQNKGSFNKYSPFN